MRKFNLFNFLEKKVETAQMQTVTTSWMDQIAFKQLALHIGISYIANIVSKCEFKTFENGEEVQNKLYYILNVSPNPNQNSSQFINKFVEQYYYDGHALIVPHGEHIYCADGFSIDKSNPLKEYSFNGVVIDSLQLKKKYKASEVFYMKLDNKNVKNLIDNLYKQYGEVLSAAITAYKRSAGKKYKLLLNQYSAGDKEFKETFDKIIKAQLQSFIKSDNAVYPQYRETDLVEMPNSMTTSGMTDIVSMRKEIFETTAQALKIPPSIMMGNITNMNEIVKECLSTCIDPLADMIGEELTRKYYTFDEWKKGYRIQVDTSCINHVDILEVADKVEKAISSGVCCIDDLRKRLNMNTLNTEFSTSHFMTKNFALAEDILKSDAQKGGV